MDEFSINDGVRRAKAAEMVGRKTIPAHVFSPDGRFLYQSDVPIDCLYSPKSMIERISPADEARWTRAVAGAASHEILFPPIEVQAGTRGVKLDDVEFDFGDNS